MTKYPDIESYYAAIPEPGRTTLLKVRATIRSIVPPESTEGFYYSMPAFHYHGGLVAIAAFKDHCSLFPLGSSAIEQFREELKGYQVSKGTIHFPLDKPLPAPLIKKIVKARVAQNELRAKLKSKPPAARRSPGR